MSILITKNGNQCTEKVSKKFMKIPITKNLGVDSKAFFIPKETFHSSFNRHFEHFEAVVHTYYKWILCIHLSIWIYICIFGCFVSSRYWFCTIMSVLYINICSDESLIRRWQLKVPSTAHWCDRFHSTLRLSIFSDFWQ